MKEGIYFNMTREEYDSLPYFNQSMAKYYINDSTGLEAWQASNKEESKATPAMELGKAIHKAILEPDLFTQEYCKKPSPEDYQNKQIIKSADDIKTILESVGEKKTGLKADLIDRVRDYIDPDTQILWDDLLQSKENQTQLNPEIWETIQAIKEELTYYPQAQELLDDGYSEVVVINRDAKTGVMCKGQIDRIRPELIGDIKTFSLKNPSMKVQDAINSDIARYKYYLQSFVYQDMIEQVIPKIRNDKAVIRGDISQAWLDRFLENKEKQFFFLFVRTQAPYQMEIVEMKKAIGSGGEVNYYYSLGKELFYSALRAHEKRISEYGNEKPRPQYIARILDDADVPSLMYQSSEV